MKSTHPRSDLFRHATDVAAQNGTPIGQRLLNDHRRILPPNRRNDQPTVASNDFPQVLRSVGAIKPYATVEFFQGILDLCHETVTLIGHESMNLNMHQFAQPFWQ